MRLKIVLPSFVVLGGILACSTASYSKPADAKKTGKACAFCHVDVKNKEKVKDLTDAGKFYKEKGTLEGYVAK